MERALRDDHFGVIMVCYSFLEPDAAHRIFPVARAKDVGILAMKPFSGGVIEDSGLALRYALSTPGRRPHPGSETVEKARENWKIYAAGQPLTDADRARMEQVRQHFRPAILPALRLLPALLTGDQYPADDGDPSGHQAVWGPR